MFLKQALKNLETIGAFTPLSNACIATFLHSHNRQEVRHVVELGGGTWVFSTPIVQSLHSEAHLTTYEINEAFAPCYKHLDRSTFTLRMECASTLSHHVEPQSVDIVLCTIPFTFLDQAIATTIVENSQHVLKSGGSFCLFQYSPLKQRFFEETLSGCVLEKKQRILRNFPPAVFFVFRKQ